MTNLRPPLRARVKRAIANGLLAIPGGQVVVNATRATLAKIRGFDVHKMRDAASEWIQQGRPELALAAQDKILSLYPHDLATRLARVQTLLRLDRVQDAHDECVALGADPDFPVYLQDHLRFRMAETQCRLGNTAEGLRLFRIEDDITKRHNAAELMINDYVDFEAANRIYASTEAYQEKLAKWFGPSIEFTRFYTSDWVRLIGHLGLLDLCVKARKLGWMPCERMVLVAPPKMVANTHYLEYYKPFFEISDSPLVSLVVDQLGPRVACRLKLPGGTAHYFCEGMGAIQESWEKDNRAPLLSLTPEDQQFADELYRDLGIPAGSWIVATHARSPGFHWEKGNPHQAHRNTDIQTYFPAMKEIVRRGGYVVRMGDPTMPRLPEMPGIIDYAHSPHKSQRADVVLSAKSRFFIGCASGLCHLPVTFGVPTLVMNWCSNQLPIYGASDRFIPKRLKLRETGRDLTFAEMLEPHNRVAAYSGTKLISRGLEWIDNTEDEILAAVEEMMDPPAEPNEWVSTFDRLARASGEFGFSRIVNAFAAKHAKLFAT